MPTIGGLVSGIDTSKMIEGLMSIHQNRIDRLKLRHSEVVSKQTAFKGVEARLLTLRSKAAALTQIQNNSFKANKAVSSIETAVTAAASDSALPGVYALKVNQLAKAQIVASQGFESADSTISQGTISLQVGAGVAKTVTIDSTNNTVQGLVDAINNSGAEVSATIINEGTSGATPYRLLLTSKKTGAANTIQIVNNLATAGGGASRPSFGESSIGSAVAGGGNASTSVAESNSGSAYSGAANDVYTFTVVQGGMVGTDNGLQISYQDGSGENTGTITLNDTDVGALKSVAEGLQIQFGAGTLEVGDTFTVAVNAAATPVQASADAIVALGSGSGQLLINSATNHVDNLIPGVSLNLLTANPTQEVSITVTPDMEKASEAINEFVGEFNSLMGYIDEQVRFDAETGQAQLLLGNSTVTSIQDSVRRAVTDSVAGLGSQLNRLSAIGITVTTEGRLTVNSAKLGDALSGRIPGVSLNDVRRFFALDGASDNGNVTFLLGTAKTKESAIPYQVDITQAAERATILATNTITDSTVINGTNNTLTLSIDGKASSTLTLGSGTYTRQQLAEHLQAVIASDQALTGREVTVSVDGSSLRITSESYGSSSEVTVKGGASLAALGFAGTETDIGVNVAGNFIVNGVVEEATGTGRLLMGKSTNKNTADLQVRVSLTPTQVQAGVDAKLTVTRGIASRLDQVIGALLDPVSGRLKTVNDGFEDDAANIQSTIDKQNERFEAAQASLQAQFAAMESAVSQLQSTGNYLAAQMLGQK